MKSKKIKIILTVGIIFLALVGIFGRDKFVAFAQSVIDSFSDTSKVDDTWNVTVDTATGEVKLAEQSCDDGTWFCSASTTCTNTLGDGDYIIVADENETTTKQWKTALTNCDLPQCGIDGGQDGDNLVADNTTNFAEYPARDACATKGGRLPTRTELECIYTNRATFGDNFGTGYFWSGTEYTTANAWYVNFSTGSSNGTSKAGSNYIRCVQGL